jgi:hypothetical protein
VIPTWKVTAMLRPRLYVFVFLLGLVPALGFWGPQTQPAAGPAPTSLETEFRDTINPFITTYCTGCHAGKQPKGDLDLSVYTSVEKVARDFGRWATVLEQLESGTMPPSKAKQHPMPKERAAVVAWIRDLRKDVAKKTAGDPGPVLARRLSNAEYDYTIRDLTGVDLRPAREFPVDPANEAGFDNSGESLTMSPALLKKYLAAATWLSEHVIFQPDGFTFAPYPVVADTDRDKFCVRRIIDFYQRQRTDYADYFEAAWRFQHRAALGKPQATLADTATQVGVSGKYLATVWDVLTGPPEETGPTAALRALWQELPPADGKPEAVRAGCVKMRDFVVQLRQQLVPEVKNLNGPKMNGGSQPLVLWKNRQMAANRQRYAGGTPKLKLDELKLTPTAAQILAVPAEPDAVKKYQAAFARFCAVFPDAFYISERARVYLDPKEEAKLKGRLLSAGFHSMTGYFRDDGPLYQLILSEDEQRELDRLWLEFDCITNAPIRQHTSMIWFERAESGFLRGAEAEYARAEDKDSTSDAKMQQMAELCLTRAMKYGASATVLKAIQDHFAIALANIRRVEKTRQAAEPKHLEALQKFAERAYRRPLAKAERDGLVSFYRVLRDKDGLSHEEAVRDVLVSVLVSPHFLFRAERGDGKPGVRPLSDHALASRLSYFLWSSLPDAELLARAAAGDLRKPEVLHAQAKRMVLDPKVRGLATEFAGHWLDFRRFEEHNAVDRERFKAFTDDLRRAMFEEPVRFFLDVVRSDRSVLDFLYAKHTFVNPVLARHYGMPEPKGGADSWAKVDDARKFGRGGLLPMAVFLTKNSPGLRTSPVKRGYWVVRQVLGERIPPPPPQVPELPADEAKLGELTLREVLARHRVDKACAGCHQRFDGIGLAFEGYGPVGELRTKDLGGRPVDTHAAFPGGTEGAGLEGLLAYVKEKRQEDFVDNLCRKMLTFALGRTLLPADDLLVQEMRQRLVENDYRFGVLIETIITSPQFLNRRGEG